MKTAIHHPIQPDSQELLTKDTGENYYIGAYFKGGINSGFYELVHEGACMFIMDHKTIQKIQDGAVTYSYTPKRYIINSAAVFRIKGKRSLLKALSDKDEQINQYIKQANMHVKAADKEQIRAVVEYYTDLKN